VINDSSMQFYGMDVMTVRIILLKTPTRTPYEIAATRETNPSKIEKSPTIIKIAGLVVRHKGFEPLTFAFVVRYSIQLS
jgi:formylmethanofuran dehydrogenase subunit E-like metal-binding protein